MFYLNIIDELEKVMGKFKDFVFEHYSNPLMWLGFFFIGVALFFFVYNALQKEK